jgi:F0F1-type ATP synthase assembly protein I
MGQQPAEITTEFVSKWIVGINFHWQEEKFAHTKK